MGIGRITKVGWLAALLLPLLARAEPAPLRLAGAKSLCTPLRQNATEIGEALGFEIAVSDTGGSQGGIFQVALGRADVACIARELSEAEGKQLAYERVAEDALAAVVNPALPIQEISSGQLRAIYSGEVRLWSQIDPELPPTPIAPITTQRRSGTRSNIRRLLLGGAEIRADALLVETMGHAPEALLREEPPGAIALVSPALIADHECELRVIPVDGALPEARGSYPLQRDLGFAYPRSHPRSGDIARLVEHVRRRTGARHKDQVRCGD